MTSHRLLEGGSLRLLETGFIRLLESIDATGGPAGTTLTIDVCGREPSSGACDDTVFIGQFIRGEVPAPLVYQFLDENGDPIVITGYIPTFRLREVWGGTSLLAAQLFTDGTDGKVMHIWTGLEFANAGDYVANFTITNGTNTFISIPIKFNVRIL